jgi:cellulose synthase/poly-beta-1,6-N-acetylglucosamine synthase-like glycosyltransferase
VADLSLPFHGLPTAWTALFTVALVVIVAMLAWTALLFARGRWARAHPPEAAAGADRGFTWAFLVPALNEEVTIADSVRRLLEIELDRRLVVVIDDGSEDSTPEVLRRLEHPDLHVIRREPPDARRGKAAALNHGYRALGELLHGADRDRVIVAVVDADGRLDPSAPHYAAAHFASDANIGGVQSLVRIYNRDRLLTWLQDIEFSVYGYLFQAGRNGWGTAGMGGNGQFNRLRALDQIADHDGPWRDRLTEDQDLGLRLIAAGWSGRQELRARVDQQGLPGLRRLFRQRTRWSQGNLQAIGLAGAIRRAPIRPVARLELLAYLLMPLWQTLVGATLVAAIGLAIAGVASFWTDGPWWQLVFFYLLGFGGTMLGCVAARAGGGPLSYLRGIAIAQLYAFYSWLLWPVLVRSALRQLTERRDWTKTEREGLRVGGSDQPASLAPRLTDDV